MPAAPQAHEDPEFVDLASSECRHGHLLVERIPIAMPSRSPMLLDHTCVPKALEDTGFELESVFAFEPQSLKLL